MLVVYDLLNSQLSIDRGSYLLLGQGDGLVDGLGRTEPDPLLLVALAGLQQHLLAPDAVAGFAEEQRSLQRIGQSLNCCNCFQTPICRHLNHLP